MMPFVFEFGALKDVVTHVCGSDHQNVIDTSQISTAIFELEYMYILKQVVFLYYIIYIDFHFKKFYSK